ncbi:MAG: aldolase [Nitrosospira sp.]|nr:aldolase [Nitrosospira sp.]
MSYGSDFVLTLFTNDIELARRADEAGINRIGLDLERLGKAARQQHLNTWISDHDENQLPALRQALNKSKLFVRTNPPHPRLGEEIDRLIEAGAEVLMLPMFRTAEDAANFIEYIDGRAEVSLLIETAAAAVRIDEIVQFKGIDEVHIGLNDLHRDVGLKSHFELLRYQFMNTLSDSVHNGGIPFGFGGIGRVNDDRLPIPSDLIYAQYPRLRADRALVSRVFTSPDYTQLDLTREVAAFRDCMDKWNECPEQDLIEARDMLWMAAKTL